MNEKLLIVDDEPGMRQMLEILFRKSNYDVEVEKSAQPVINKIKEGIEYSVIITDLVLPDGDGIEILKEVKHRFPETQVILITAFGTTDSAVMAMKEGAYDFIEKPFSVEEMKLLVDRAFEKRLLLKQNTALIAKFKEQLVVEKIVARSNPMKKILSLIKQVAPTNSNVLLTGESGTGKEVIARAIHKLSTRNTQKFVTINCGAIPEDLLESELFGHIKGAFTGAVSEQKGLFKEADGGTLFLDEIGELPLTMQVKILRAIQEKKIRPVGNPNELEIDVRIIAASNKNLELEVKNDRFRQDLYYRLNVIHINLPPLRERKEDILILAQIFLDFYCATNNKKIIGLTPAAMKFLIEYNYPGNIRELENIIERGVTLSVGNMLDIDSLNISKQNDSIQNINIPEIVQGFDIDKFINNIEYNILITALEKSNGNKTKAAELLGISFRSLRYRLQKHGLDSED